MNENGLAAQLDRQGIRVLKALLALGISCVILGTTGVVLMTWLGRAAGSYARDEAAVPVASAASAPATSQPDWRKVGTSVQGRPILAASFGSGERRVLIIGGVHGSEFGGDVAERFAEWLEANPTAVPPGTRVDIIGCANPDGRAAGIKGNAHAVNLNGNFPTSNWKTQEYLTTTAGPSAGSEPETQVILRMLARNGYTRVISLHSEGGLVDYNGSGGFRLASRIASASGFPVKKFVPESAYAGSLGTYVPERYGIPVLTIELLSRRMDSDVRAGLLAAIR